MISEVSDVNPGGNHGSNDKGRQAKILENSTDHEPMV